MTVDEARRGLHSLVKEFRAVEEPVESVYDRAVEVGPFRQGGLLMMPEVDARAMTEKLEELEENLEAIGMAFLVEERRASAAPGDYQPIEDLVRQFGFAELLDVPAPARQGAVAE